MNKQLFHLYAYPKNSSRQPFLVAGWLNAVGVEFQFQRVRKIWTPNHYNIRPIKCPKYTSPFFKREVSI